MPAVKMITLQINLFAAGILTRISSRVYHFDQQIDYNEFR